MASFSHVKKILRYQLKSLDNDKHLLVFGLMCCARMYPNYEDFCRKTKFADFSIIREDLHWMWEKSIDASFDIKELESRIQSHRLLFPHSEQDFELHYRLDLSIPLGVGIGIDMILQYLKDRDRDDIVYIALQSIELACIYLSCQKNIGEPEDYLNHNLVTEEYYLNQENIKQIVDKDSNPEQLYNIYLGNFNYKNYELRVQEKQQDDNSLQQSLF